MSTLLVANIHLESTGNNRIQFNGSNSFSIVAGGTNWATVNSTVMTVNGGIQSRNLVVSPQTANYTLTAADSGAVITMSNTALTTVTVPASLPVGYRCMVYMIGTGNVAIGNAAGVTLNSRTGAFTVSQRYGAASILVHAANTVLVEGSV